ncbi:hypothetical protein V3N99_12670 [Dermatophilaceae bacterium Soc4.6]
MIAASLMLLAGFGLIALGLVQHTMYDIGAVVVVIAAVGLAVRTVDVVRWLRH